MKASALFLALAVAAGTACAGGAADSVQVANPYVRAIPPGAKATGAFMTLKNDGADTQLVKAESKAAKRVELHNHIDNNGVMEMREVPSIAVKSKGEAALKPGSYHIMLIEPTTSLKPGDSISLTLRFADGSSKQVDAPVKMPEAMPMSAPSGHDHMRH